MTEGGIPGLESDTDDLYEHAPCGYLSTLPDGTIVRANQTFCDWIGIARTDLVGQKRIQSLLAVGSRIYYETHYSPLLQIQGFVNEIALEIRRSDGAIRPVVASATQRRGDDGVATVNRVALFDSTDRRRYEHEILQARQRAEEALEGLEKANERKSQFIAMLAHELRNPLAPICNSLELLRRSDNHAAVIDKAAGVMNRQVAQIVRLVEDLFDISRLGQDKFSIRRVPIDLASVVHQAVETSAPLLESAGLTFSSALPTTPIYVDADAGRLAQVIGNVLNNAAKFTPRGGAVRLSLETGDEQAAIRIRDTGIGIDAEQLPHIFEMFMQAGMSLTDRGGLGLGLTLAKSLIERHGGRITVDSAGLGKGAEFTIRIPTLSVAPESVARAFGRVPAELVQPQRKRVLVVDDNKDSTSMMSMLLEFAGHEVRVAHDGPDAVEALPAFQPHVVLLDIGLPQMNGYEVARRIRQQGGMQPVLAALTGWGQNEDRVKSSAAGFDVHLVKPVDHDVLTKLINDAPMTGRP